jgi:hypothetical protein
MHYYPSTIKNATITLYFVFFYLYSPHTMANVSLRAANFEIWMLINLAMLFALTSILIIALKGYQSFMKDNFDISFVSVIFLYLISDLYRIDPLGAIGWGVLLATIVIIKNCNNSSIHNFFKTYIFIITGIAIYAIYTSVLVRLNIKQFEAFPYMSLNYMLLHHDSFKYVFGMSVPRISAHLQQVSLIPAYFIFPLGIGMLFFNIKWKYFFAIVIFSLLSLSGSIYYLFISSIALYVFHNTIRKYKFLIPLCFLVFMLILSFTIAVLYDFAIKPMANSEASALNDNFILRLSSGMSRLSIIGRGIREFLESPILGFIREGNISLFLLGSLVVSAAVRAGILALVLIVYIYYLLIIRLNKLKITNNKEKVGFTLVYASLLMMMSYQDYGFGSIHGFLLLFILAHLIKNRREYELHKNQSI